MVFGVIILAAVAARADDSSKASAVPQHIQDQYQQAFQYFSSGEYPKAVLKWEQILQESPTQATARTMIAKARNAIWKVTKDRQEKINAMVRAGQYQKAQVELQPFLDLDPDDPRLESFRQRLQNVLKITPTLPGEGKAGRAALIGVGAYLSFEPDYQLAYDGLRYAIEKGGENDLYRRLVELLLTDQPQLARDEVTPGMTLIAYKQHMGLSDIYDARYSDAIKALVDVIRLEPENLTAWERLGSSYYCLGLKSEAAQAWKEALKLSPDDPSLQKFLKRKKPLKCGSH